MKDLRFDPGKKDIFLTVFFGVVPGSAIGLKSPNQTCWATCCGETVWISEQPKVTLVLLLRCSYIELRLNFSINLKVPEYVVKLSEWNRNVHICVSAGTLEPTCTVSLCNRGAFKGRSIAVTCMRTCRTSADSAVWLQVVNFPWCPSFLHGLDVM